MLLARGLPNEIVPAIMMLYKNMKAMVHSLDESTDFFSVAEVLQDTLTLYLFILCQDYVL